MSKDTAAVFVVALTVFASMAAPAAQIVFQGGQSGPGPVRDPTRPPRVQPVPVGTGQITGTVTAAATGLPIAGAIVRLTGASRVPIAEGAAAVGRPGAPGSAQGGAIGGGAARGTGGGLADAARGSAAVPGLPLNRTTASDASGRFTFDHLPAGQFTLSATQQQQFLALNYGEKQYGRPGAPFPLEDGERREFVLRLTHAGAISGAVVGEDGQPLVGALVRAARYGMANGFRRLLSQRAVQTDDRGMFRVFGLVPGDYVVSATPSPADLMLSARALDEAAVFQRALAEATARGTGLPRVLAVAVPGPLGPTDRPAGYLPTWFPGSTSPSGASIITLGPGVERDGLLLQVQPIRATNVIGSIAGYAWPAGAVEVFARSDDPSADTSTIPLSSVGPDGTFLLRDLAPGQYTIHAQTVVRNPASATRGAPVAAPQPELPRLYGRMTLMVDGVSPPPPVIITLAPGRTVSGRLVQDSPDAGRPRVSINLVPEPSANPIPQLGPPPAAQVSADGTFVLPDVFPGRYLFRIPTARSALVAGQDALDFPFEVPASEDVTDVTITLARQVAALTGRLTEAAGAPTSEYTIILAPSDSRYWMPGSRRILIARPGVDGAFRFVPVPAGSYMLAALSDLEPGSQFDPQFLRELANASLPVTIGEGATQTQDIRLAR